MTHTSIPFYIKLSLTFIAIATAIFSINTSSAQESEAYITSSHPRAEYYYPESCDLWKVLSGSYIERFDSLQALEDEYGDSREIHPHCVEEESEEPPAESEEEPSEPEENQNPQEPSGSNPVPNIIDGDLIQSSGDIDVYIVKIVGQKRFKRLILNPTIFESYDHLDWDNIKIVPRSTLSLYTTSNMVQEINPDGSIADERVFQLFPSGDSGMKRHIELTFDEFIQAGGDPDSIYYINSVEAGNAFYNTGTVIDDMDEFKEVLLEQEQEQEENEQEVEDGTSVSPERGPITFIPSPQPPAFSLGTINGIIFIEDESANNYMHLGWINIPGATDYELEYHNGDGNYISTDVTITQDSATSTAHVTGLEPDTAYTFRVMATAGDITGPWSPTTTYTTFLLDTVSGTNLIKKTDIEVNINLDSVTDATGYQVQYKLKDSSDSTYSGSDVSVSVVETLALLTGLEPDTEYTIRARAVKNPQGLETPEALGGWLVQDHRTLATRLAEPVQSLQGLHGSTQDLNTVGDLEFGATTSTQINLSWEAIQQATTYDVQYKIGASGWSSKNVVVTGTTAKIINLEPSTEYTFRVRAVLASAVIAPPPGYTPPPGASPVIASAPLVGEWSREQTHSTNVSTKVGDITFGTILNINWDAVAGAAEYEVMHKLKDSSDSTYSDTGVTFSTTTSAQITGLAPEPEYMIRIRALDAQEAEMWAIEYVDSTITDGKISLSWLPVEGATGYEVEHKNRSRDYVDRHVRVVGTTATVTSLEENLEYTFRVKAIGTGGTEEWSDPKTYFTWFDPTPVSSIDRIEYGTSYDRIRIEWDHVAGATDYDVRYKLTNLSDPNNNPWKGLGPQEGVAVNLFYLQTNDRKIRADILGLGEDTEYDIQVRAKASKSPQAPHRLGPWSSSQIVLTFNEFGQVQNVGSERTSQAEIMKITWDSLSGSTKYEVQYRVWTGSGRDRYSEENSVIVNGEATTEATLENLDVNTYYHFRVRARNASSVGPWQEGTFTTSLPSISTLTFGTTTHSEINLSWGAVDMATGYEAMYCDNTNPSDCASEANWSGNGVTITGTTAKITGLTAGTTYRLRVKAIKTNPTNDGPWLLGQSFTSPLQPVGLITFSNTTEVVTTLSWIAIDGATSYEAEYCNAASDCSSEANWSDSNVSYPTTVSAVISNISRGTKYKFRVRAKSGDVNGPWSEAQEHSTLLGTVENVVLSGTTQTGVNVDWDAVTGATGYEVRYHHGNGVYITIGVSNTIRDITGLSPGTIYTFQVRATTDDVNGPWSQEQNITTLLGQVGNITFSGTTQVGTTMTWGAIAGAEEYGAQYCDTRNSADCSPASTNWVNITLSDPASPTATVTGLAINTSYLFRARAITSDVGGEWSIAQENSTLALPPVGTITFTEITQTAIRVSWDPIDGATRYEMQRKEKDESDSSYTSVNLPSATVSVINLDPGTTYTFRVRAETGSINGPWSAEQDSSTLLGTVGTITAVAGTNPQTDVDLSWPSVTGADEYEAAYCDATTPADCSDPESANWIAITLSDSTQPAATVTGLTDSTPYLFRARAITDYVTGEWSESASYTTASP